MIKNFGSGRRRVTDRIALVIRDALIQRAAPAADLHLQNMRDIHN